MFEKIVRMKARFDSPQGQLTAEDLFDIPLISSNKNKANLDDIARNLSKQVKEAETESFVFKPPKADETTALKFELVKYIISVRLAENAAAKVARDNREKKQQLLELISHKENEQLAGQSIDDLRKMVEAL
jgi:hypothetical protein